MSAIGIVCPSIRRGRIARAESIVFLVLAVFIAAVVGSCAVCSLIPLMLGYAAMGLAVYNLQRAYQ